MLNLYGCNNFHKNIDYFMGERVVLFKCREEQMLLDSENVRDKNNDFFNKCVVSPLAATYDIVDRAFAKTQMLFRYLLVDLNLNFKYCPTRSFVSAI